MNPLRQLSNIVSLMIALLVIGWFGLTCFKAGWYARNQPVFSPILLKFLDSQQSSKDG